MSIQAAERCESGIIKPGAHAEPENNPRNEIKPQILRDGDTARPSASRIALADKTGRPPRRPINRPTKGETKPASTKPSERPPIIQVEVHPVSAAIGFASTAGK